MRQWVLELRENKLLIIPKLFAILYGSFGVFSLFVFLIAIVTLVVGSTPFSVDGLGIVGVVLLIAVYLGITFISLSLAKGFWWYEKWVPGFTIFIHSMLIFGQITGIWRGDVTPSAQTYTALAINILIVVVLLIPPVRRLFQ